jgi:hypothetical protein
MIRQYVDGLDSFAVPGAIPLELAVGHVRQSRDMPLIGDWDGVRRFALADLQIQEAPLVLRFKGNREFVSRGQSTSLQCGSALYPTIDPGAAEQPHPCCCVDKLSDRLTICPCPTAKPRPS